MHDIITVLLAFTLTSELKSCKCCHYIGQSGLQLRYVSTISFCGLVICLWS